jgi:NAD+ synthase (glutamine-hydrolysing)
MPCFGTTDRTFQNACKLTKALGATLKKVDIAKSVTRHLKDIKHQDGVYDVTYENAQARERTQVIMDISNMLGGLVVGTGDLSELALGWATYNGDHMSMYGVNGAIPKTLVRHLVNHTANVKKGKIKAILLDVLDTPVSPELLPTENGVQGQQTEDIVGPYILHDFFLYNMIRRGFSPKKLYYVAENTFKGDFSEQTILKWLKIFVRRFFIQQFKRSCVPDGVKVGTVGLSPRGDWFMPSDAVSLLWQKELEEL